jgi:hypothetical protein
MIGMAAKINWVQTIMLIKVMMRIGILRNIFVRRVSPGIYVRTYAVGPPRSAIIKMIATIIASDSIVINPSIHHSK